MLVTAVIVFNGREGGYNIDGCNCSDGGKGEHCLWFFVCFCCCFIKSKASIPTPLFVNT